MLKFVLVVVSNGIVRLNYFLRLLYGFGEFVVNFFVEGDICVFELDLGI